MMELITCKNCGQDLGRDLYYSQPYKSARPRQPCKACHSVKRREHYRANGGSENSYGQLLKREYGLTLAGYRELFAAQDGNCAVCLNPETAPSRRTGRPRRLVVDFDVEFKRVRSLVCQGCHALVKAVERRVNATTVEEYLRGQAVISLAETYIVAAE